MSSARAATLLIALLSAAFVSSAAAAVCEVDVTKTSAARAKITRPLGDTGATMTVMFEVPLERLGDDGAPENFLRSFRFSSNCDLAWAATTIGTNGPETDMSIDNSPFDAIYDSGNTGGTGLSGGWSWTRDDSGSCSMVQFTIQRNIEQLISAGCLNYDRTTETGFEYRSEFRLERWYSLTQTFPASGDIPLVTRTAGRYVSEYFSVQVEIQKSINAEATAVSGEVVNGFAVMPSTNNALSSVTIGQLDSNNQRQVTAQVTVLVNYPFKIFALTTISVANDNLPVGISGVSVGDCTPTPTAPFSQFGDVCQQVVTITYDADDCSTSRDVELPASVLKYKCASGTFAAGHCDGENSEWDFVSTPTDTVLAVRIVSDVECAYNGQSYSGAVTATATFAKGQLGGGAWVHASGSGYFYYFGNNPTDTPNGNVYVDVIITNDANIDDPTDIASVTFSAQSAVNLGSSTIQGTSSTNTDTSSTGCGSNDPDQYTGCLIVPLPTNIPRDNNVYDVSVAIDATVTLSLPPDRKRAAGDRVIRLNLDAATKLAYKPESTTGVVTGAASPATIAIAVIIAVVGVAAIGGAVLLAIVIRKSQAAAAAASP